MFGDLDRIAGSAFVALILTMIAVWWLARLYMDERKANRTENARQWEIVGTMAAGLQESNEVVERALDEREGRAPLPPSGRKRA